MLVKFLHKNAACLLFKHDTVLIVFFMHHHRLHNTKCDLPDTPFSLLP